MGITTRRFLVSLVWTGLILVRPVTAQEAGPPPAAPQPGVEFVASGPEEVMPQSSPPEPDWLIGSGPEAGPVTAGPQPGAEVVAPGPRNAKPQSPPPAPELLVGEAPPSVDQVFGVPSPQGCPICGGGACLPPDWSVDNEISFLSRDKARAVPITITEHVDLSYPRILTTPNVPNTDPANQKWLIENIPNVTSPLMNSQAGGYDVTPQWGFNLTRYLGRDANGWDHFLEFNFAGLGRFAGSHTVGGDFADNHVTTFAAATYNGNQVTNPNTLFTLEQHGNLYSLFGLFDINSAPTFNDYLISWAFNAANQHVIHFTSDVNNWELATRIDSPEQADVLVMNANGRWYRQCHSGFRWSCLFGLRAMSADEKFEFLSQATATVNDTGVATPAGAGATNQMGQPIVTSLGQISPADGRYVVRTENTLLGLELGGKVEYRCCRWDFDVSGKVSPCMNFAGQQSRIQVFDYTDPNLNFGSASYDHPWDAQRNVPAIIVEFGVGTEYKFRPNWVGRASYDFHWVGGVALAPGQLAFQADPTPQIVTNGVLFYHGLTLGMEYNW